MTTAAHEFVKGANYPNCTFVISQLPIRLCHQPKDAAIHRLDRDTTTITVAADSSPDPSLPTHCDHSVSLDDPCEQCRVSEPQAAPPERIWIVCDGDDHFYTEGEEPEGGISYTRTSTAEALAEALRPFVAIKDAKLVACNGKWHVDPQEFAEMIDAACEALARWEKGES